ncbi:MAG: NAD(P)H-hydrate dehydratase [Methanomassiliicoccales archaeon]
MKISTVEQMRELDRGAIEDYDIEDLLLMENAGLAVYSTILQEFGMAGKRFLIFCGPGNNGGDGLVVARKILSNGGVPKVLLMSDPEKYSGAAERNYRILTRLPIEVEHFSPEVRGELLHSHAVIDAMLGTGLDGEVRGKYREAIELINSSPLPVFSVDIPSGVNGNTGKVMGTAVQADLTVTFGLPKVGNILYPGFDHCGKLYVSHISFPPEHYDQPSLEVEVGLPSPLPSRRRDGHKGTFGQALFVAGAASYQGAPYFSALSFLRAGGGYSRLATPASISPFLANRGSEIVFHPQKETERGSLSLESEGEILELADQVDFVVIGPGLSLDEETRELVRLLVRRIGGPVLVDGDGITAVAEDTGCVSDREWPTVLTPHPGEMGRLAGRSVKEVMEDPIGSVQEVAVELDCILVLKTAHSLIGLPDGRVMVNMSGNPGMGSAGSGDVLTGTVGAMYGLGLPLVEAVVTGVFVHGLAGDLAATNKGEDGMTAQDILDHLPEAMVEMRCDHASLCRDHYGSIFLA